MDESAMGKCGAVTAKDGVVTGEDESATGEGDGDMAVVDDSNSGADVRRWAASSVHIQGKV